MYRTKITMEEVRERYPYPKSGDVKRLDSEYCVGGALSLYLGYETKFPGHYNLSRLLIEANPTLEDENAVIIARRIVFENDRCQYETAWQHLKQALTY